MQNAAMRALLASLSRVDMRGVRLLLGLVLLMQSAAVVALAPQPHELVDTVITRVMARLGERESNDAAAQARMLQLFEEELSPHFAFETIAQWIAGPNWATFSEEERAEILAALHEYIVHVYATLLARGRDVAIRIDPNSTMLTKSAKVVGVMATPDGRDYQLEFKLLRSDGSWKLYDLAVDGLSFARSLHAELRPIVDVGGVSALREYLQQHQ